MEVGYIKLHRKILSSEVMKSAWLCQLWIWCLLKAHWKTAGIDSRGQFTTTRPRGSEELRVSPSKFYEGLQRLKELGCVEIESNNKATTITICNYELYQDYEDWNQAAGNNKATTKQQLTIIEEEGKNERTGAFEDFDLSDIGLAQSFVFYATAHAGRSKRDTEKGITAMVSQTSLRVPRQAILDEIKRSDRNRNEWYSVMETRLLQKYDTSATGKKITTDEELLGSTLRFANRGKDQNGTQD